MANGAFDLGQYGAELVLDSSKFDTGMKKAGDQMNQTDDKVKGFAGSMGTIATGAIVGIGVALIGAGVAGVKMADDLDKALNQLQSATGASDQEMKGMESSLKNIYAAGYGQSFDEIANSMATVKQNTGLAGKELETATKSAYLLSDTFGMDVTESSRTAKAMMEQFGISSQDAFNLMAQGAQNGANKNGDLLDSLNEYAPQFSAMGFSASEFTNVLIDGAKNGAFSIDKVGDAMKEFNIRSKDGSKTSIDAFKSLGFNANEMSSNFAKGGETAQKSFTQVMGALNKIKDPVEKNRIGVELFGTQFEDLEAKGISALANIGTTANTSKNTLGEMAKIKYSSIGEAFSGIGRSIQIALIEPMQKNVLPLLSDFANFIQANMPQIQSTISSVFSGMGTGIKTAIDMFSTFSPVIAGLVTAFTAYKAITMASTIATTAMATAQGIMNAVMAINPVTLIVAALIGLGVALVVAYQKSETFRNIVNGVWESVKGAWVATVSFFTTSIPQWINGMVASFDKFKTSALEKWNSFKQGTASVFNAVKDFFAKWGPTILAVLTGPIGIVVLLISKNWNSIKNTTMSIWNSVTSFLSNLWRTLTTSASSIFSALRSSVISIFSNLKNGIVSATNATISALLAGWNSAKTAVSNAVNSIRTFVSNAFTSLRTVVTTAMSGVKNAVSNGWKSAVSFLKGINLASVGRNIIQGLINGIGGMVGAIRAKVKSIADSVTSTFKKVLDIHSPSRVTDKIGQETGQGFANGISKKKKAAEKAAKDAANAAKKAFANAMDKAEYKFKMGQINATQFISQLRKIRDEYAKTPEQVRKVNLEIKSIQDKNAKEIKSLQDKQFKDALKTIKDKADAGKLSASQELSQLQALAKHYKKNSDERLQIDKEMKKVKDKLLKEQFDHEKTYIENKKFYNQLSLTEELDAYEKYVRKYKKGSDERIFYEKEIYRVKTEINDKLTSLNDEYSKKIADANQKFIDGEKALNEEYNKAVADRTQSLYGFAGIFDAITEKSDISGQQLLDNLQGQVNSFTEWAANIKALAAKGIDEGLLKELQDMGPKAGAEIAALNTLTDTGLEKYVALWKEKNALAKAQAIEELQKMNADTKVKIKELRYQTSVELEIYKQEWASKIKEISTGTTDEFVQMNTTMRDIGQNTIGGLMEGLDDMAPDLMDQVASIADSIASTLKSALEIKSPSRVMRKIGQFISEGLSIGITDNQSLVDDASLALTDSLISMTPSTQFQPIMSNLPSLIGNKVSSSPYYKNNAQTANVSNQQPQLVGGDISVTFKVDKMYGTEKEAKSFSTQIIDRIKNKGGIMKQY